jgi:hypothetical protein
VEAGESAGRASLGVSEGGRLASHPGRPSLRVESPLRLRSRRHGRSDRHGNKSLHRRSACEAGGMERGRWHGSQNLYPKQSSGEGDWLAFYHSSLLIRIQTPSPGRLHSFPAFTHSQAYSPGRLEIPKSTPLLIAHYSLLIRPQGRSQGRFASPLTSKP